MQNGKKVSENVYKKGLIARLKKKFRCYIIVYEAVSKTGIPDLICCFEGLFIALEVKKEIWEVYDHNLQMRESGRHIRQAHEMNLIRKNGKGFATFIYPENEAEVFKWIEAVIKLYPPKQ